MAWDRVSLTRVAVLGILALLAAADNKGSTHGLASEAIDKTQVYTGNSTAAVGQSPPVPGWWDSKICINTFCVYANQRLAGGRGLVAVTRADEFQKLERLEDHLDRAESRILQSPAPFTSTEILHKGPGLTATSPIRRGKPLLSAAPVLIVHRAFLDLVPKKKDRTRLLDTAISYLPPATQTLFNAQRHSPHLSSVEQTLLAHPFEIDLAYASHKQSTGATGPDGQPAEPDPHAHSRHFANYPEAARFQHDCRPNVATHLDGAFALRATVARKVAEGEELSVSWVDPFMERGERGRWVGRHRGLVGAEKKGCPCSACAVKDKKEGKEKDERLKEVVKIRGELRNHDSNKVDLGMVERFLELYLAERLQVKLAEAYELAAINFNYLGDDKRAKKYAELAVQAGIVEGGAESNDVAAMRVFAKDVRGHYSYRYKLKRMGL